MKKLIAIAMLIPSLAVSQELTQFENGQVANAEDINSNFTLLKEAIDSISLRAGASLLTADGPPSSGLGEIGDVFIDTRQYEFYGPKQNGGWGAPIALIGAVGPQGEIGPQGEVGPTGLTGPQGNPGPQGEIGPQGEDGLDGANGALSFAYKYLFSGSSPPFSNVPGAVAMYTDDSGAGWLSLSSVSADGTNLEDVFASNLFATLTVGSTVRVTSSSSEDGFVIYTVTSPPSTYSYGFLFSIENLVDSNPRFQDKITEGELTTVTFSIAGIQGFKGETGADGVQGPKGDKGDIGPQGIQGANGAQGPKGVAGETGPEGPQGPQGEIGPMGPTGPMGYDEGPMTFLYALDTSDIWGTPTAGELQMQFPGGYDDDQRFALSYSDATGRRLGSQLSYLLRYMQIDTEGYKSLGLITLMQRNTADRSTWGLIGFEVDGEVIYLDVEAQLSGTNFEFEDGTEYILGLSLRGNDGAQGVQGPAGPQGVKGATGSIGPKGETGLRGPQGDIGPQGEAGPQGEVGLRGETGATGPKGDKGDTGAVGPRGPQGETGATGPKGDVGDTGSTGAVGPRGPQGETGATGSNGTELAWKDASGKVLGYFTPEISNRTTGFMLSHKLPGDSRFYVAPYNVSNGGYCNGTGANTYYEFDDCTGAAYISGANYGWEMSASVNGTLLAPTTPINNSMLTRAQLTLNNNCEVQCFSSSKSWNANELWEAVSTDIPTDPEPTSPILLHRSE